MTRPNKGPFLGKNRSGNWEIRWCKDGKVRYLSCRTSDENVARKMLATFHPSQIGHVDRRIFARIYGTIRRNAYASKRPCTITIDDVIDLYLHCGGRCSVTGVQLSLLSGNRRENPWAPSIDRIDNSKGYEAGNVRMVCVAANFAMNAWGEEALYELAASMVAHKGSEKINLHQSLHMEGLAEVAQNADRKWYNG